jgi:hypothetical protein
VTDIVEDSETGVELRVPPGWERREQAPFSLVLAPGGDITGYCPSVNVLVSELAPEADIRALGTEAIAGIMGTVERARVLGYDMYLMPDGVAGRQLIFAYPDGDLTVSVCQWIFAVDGYCSTITATCAVPDLPRLEQVFQYVIDGLRLPRTEYKA